MVQINMFTKYNSATAAQRKRLEAALREAGNKGLTTIQIREQLDIMMPAARVWELRHRLRLNVQMIWEDDVNAQGNKHLCGRYVLFPGKWVQAA